MRKVISYFIKYSVAVNVLMIAIILFGLFGVSSLKSSFFPLVKTGFITINVAYPGASPEEVEEGVISKIETNLKGIEGIDRVTSNSFENSAFVFIETLSGYDVDIILQEVKNAVDKVPSFPTGMEPPVTARVTNINEAISFAVYGEGMNLATLKAEARNIENDLIAIDGISQIEISGYPEQEIEVGLDEARLRAYNITFADVARAVASTNILTSGGTIKTSTENYQIRVRNKNYYASYLEDVIIKTAPSGAVVLLSDIATVSDKWSENPDRSFFNGSEAVSITVNTTNTEDLIGAANSTIAYIEKYNANPNSNVELSVTRDRARVVKERTKLLLENGIAGIVLVLLFLSLFLRPGLAFWVAVGIPIAFLGMFAIIPSVGVTANVLSLFGMIIVIGILVDDGIVIAENIYANYEGGKSVIRAAIDGTMEVVPPILSSILTTIIAFSTFFFVEGRVGELFSEVSIVVVITLVISLVEALIILPAHIAHSTSLAQKKRTSFSINKYPEKMLMWTRERVYVPILRFFIANKLMGFVIPISFLIITIGGFAGGIIRFTFFPNISSDRVLITLNMPQGTNEQTTDSIISVIEEAAWRVNERFTAEKQGGEKQAVRNIIKRLGPGTSTAVLRLNLLPGEERNFPANEIANAIDKEVGPVYGTESLVYGAGGNFGGSPISISFVSSNSEELKKATLELKDALRNNPKVKNITDNNPEGVKEIKIKLKDKAQALGFTLSDVISQVRNAFFGFQAQRFQRGEDEVRVWVRYLRGERSSIKNLDDYRLLSSRGERVPFGEIATYEMDRGEVSIQHLDTKRVITINADLKDQKESATEILADLQGNVLPGIFAKYPSISTAQSGQARLASKTGGSATAAIPVILVLIYATIAFTFRSYSQPLGLLLMVPFCLVGVGWGHWIHGIPVNILSFLGIIALIGIVVNDGLVFIGKFNSYLKRGLCFNDALVEAGRSRFRAIVLTSVTTVAGLAPLILETSRNAQFLIPMAVSIAYGITVATFLTLLTLPLILSLANDVKFLFSWVWTGKKPTREQLERAVKEKNMEGVDHSRVEPPVPSLPQN